MQHQHPSLYLRIETLRFISVPSLYFSQPLLNLTFCKDPFTLGTLICFISHSVIYEFFGEVYTMKLKGKAIDSFELLTFTIIACKVDLGIIHFLSFLQIGQIEFSGLRVLSCIFLFYNTFLNANKTAPPAVIR